MKKAISSKGMIRWWALCIAVLVALEIGVCLLLFIPQGKALADVSKLEKDLAKQEEEVARISALLNKISGDADQVDKNLKEAKLFTGDRAEVAIMKAVAVATRECPAAGFLSLTPIEPSEAAAKSKDPATKAGPPPTEAWLIRIKGRFPDLVLYLKELEKEGLLLDSTNFEADGVKQRGTVELSVAARVCSPEDVARAVAAAQKAAAPLASAAAKE